MNILIVGCGRVGRRLVHVLERLGHDVSVLDEDAANLALLNELEPPFSGMAVAGVPIDGDVLRSAGIEACDAVAAVTKDDNINLMVAQIARELFGVKHVIARVAEPSRRGLHRALWPAHRVRHQSDGPRPAGGYSAGGGRRGPVRDVRFLHGKFFSCTCREASVEPSAFVRTAAPGGHDGIRRAARQRHDGTCQHPAYAACG